jgi:hypothetical protein
MPERKLSQEWEQPGGCTAMPPARRYLVREKRLNGYYEAESCIARRSTITETLRTQPAG